VARPKSKKQRLEEYLRERQPATITEDIWRELLALLPPISESYLRDLLHATGLEVAQPFGGVRQGSFDELAASLIEMQAVYAAAVAEHDQARAKVCRRVVIEAKDRARLIARNPRVDAEKRKQKQEMAEWILVWLENPAIFEPWAGLRRQSMAYPKQPG
jgi:hypothetical protein